MMRNFNEECPTCGKRIDVRAKWDYEVEFTFECPHCDAPVECIVHQIPEFELRPIAAAPGETKP